MAIKLQSLYEAINNQFDVILHTNSFFNKEVTWIHTVEQGEFSHLLHGDELIFNSGLNFTSQDWLKVIKRCTRQRTDHLCKIASCIFPGDYRLLQRDTASAVLHFLGHSVHRYHANLF